MGPTAPHALNFPTCLLHLLFKAKWNIFSRRKRKKETNRVKCSLNIKQRDSVQYLLKMAMEIEDDVLFADLSRQIALLIMDDEEEEFPIQSTPLHIQGYQNMPQTMMPPPPYMYEMAYRRESKGTGVFIPRSLIPKKKNRNARKTDSNENQLLDASGYKNTHVPNNGKFQADYNRNSSSLKNRM